LTPALLSPREDTAAAGALGLQPPSQVFQSANQLLAAFTQDDYLRLARHVVRVRHVRAQMHLECGQAAEHLHFIEGGLALVIVAASASGDRWWQ